MVPTAYVSKLKGLSLQTLYTYRNKQYVKFSLSVKGVFVIFSAKTIRGLKSFSTVKHGQGKLSQCQPFIGA